MTCSEQARRAAAELGQTHPGELPSPLTGISERVIKQLVKRPGWTLTSVTGKSIGPAPCRRLGFRFLAEGAKGRGRVTIVRLGRKVFVLELSAAQSHFPATTFDQLSRKSSSAASNSSRSRSWPPTWMNSLTRRRDMSSRASAYAEVLGYPRT